MGTQKVALVIEDESARVPDDLYRAMRPMLATSNGRLVLMSTPFGMRGHFWEAWTGENDWERVRVLASECSRIPATFLAEERRSLGSRWFAQEYECSFEENVDSTFGFDLVSAAVKNDVQPLFPVEPDQEYPRGISPRVRTLKVSNG